MKLSTPRPRAELIAAYAFAATPPPPPAAAEPATKKVKGGEAP